MSGAAPSCSSWRSASARRRTTAATSPRGGRSAGSGCTRSATRVITPSVPSEPTTSSRRSGPAAVAAMSSVRQRPAGVAHVERRPRSRRYGRAGRRLPAERVATQPPTRRPLVALRDVPEREPAPRSARSASGRRMPGSKTRSQRGRVDAERGRAGRGRARRARRSAPRAPRGRRRRSCRRRTARPRCPPRRRRAARRPATSPGPRRRPAPTRSRPRAGRAGRDTTCRGSAGSAPRDRRGPRRLRRAARAARRTARRRAARRRRARPAATRPRRDAELVAQQRLRVRGQRRPGARLAPAGERLLTPREIPSRCRARPSGSRLAGGGTCRPGAPFRAAALKLDRQVPPAAVGSSVRFLWLPPGRLERRPGDLLGGAPVCPRRVSSRQSARTARPRSVCSTSVKGRPGRPRRAAPSATSARAVQITDAPDVIGRSGELAVVRSLVVASSADVVGGRAARGRRGTRARRGTRSRRSRLRLPRRGRPARARCRRWRAGRRAASTRAPSASASACISSASMPYSSTYSAETRVARQLAGLARRDEAGAQLARDRAAEDEAARLSGTTESIERGAPMRPPATLHAPVQRGGVEQQRRDVAEHDAAGFGKSGISADARERSPHLAIAAQVADQQQVLEIRRDGGEVLERLDRLSAPLRITRPQRRGEDLLEQRGLAIGECAEDAQVAPGHAVPRQLGDGANDLALGLVVVADTRALFALDDAVVLELQHESRLGACLLDDILERVQRPGAWTA